MSTAQDLTTALLAPPSETFVLTQLPDSDKTALHTLLKIFSDCVASLHPPPIVPVHPTAPLPPPHVPVPPLLPPLQPPFHAPPIHLPPPIHVPPPRVPDLVPALRVVPIPSSEGANGRIYHHICRMMLGWLQGRIMCSPMGKTMGAGIKEANYTGRIWSDTV
jgi:hypothetical protein